MKLFTFSKIAVALTLTSAISSMPASAKVELIRYGDFDEWVTRHIKESGVIGGNTRELYAIGPTHTIEGNKAYYSASSPWASSNVYAKVSGITKGSNAVYPEVRSGSNKCAKLMSKMENVKVLGIINMDVMVAGSIFLGRMIEPVSSTSDPYKKMEMGVPYTHRPKALVFDYKLDLPAENTRIRSTGFGKKKTLQGRDKPIIFVMLQRRWEDANGNIHARRVASGCRLFTQGAASWQNGQKVPLVYGDASKSTGYNASVLGLRNDKKNQYYAKNSKGKMVPIQEEGWDSADATPTHAIVMISAGSGEPYVGSPGLTFYVDNVGFDI